MAATLTIHITFDSLDDLDYNRTKILSAVEEAAEDCKEQKRIEGPIEIDWEMEDA